MNTQGDLERELAITRGLLADREVEYEEQKDRLVRASQQIEWLKAAMQSLLRAYESAGSGRHYIPGDKQTWLCECGCWHSLPKEDTLDRR